MRWLPSFVTLLPLLATISPLIGMATVVVMGRWNVQLVRPMAQSNAIMTLLLIGAALWQFDPDRLDSHGRNVTRQMETVIRQHGETVSAMDVRLSFGFDGLSGWPALLVALSLWTALSLPGVIPSASFAKHCFWMFACESLLIGSFMASDAIVSLLLLEAALFPLFLLTGWFGLEDRRRAANGLWSYQFVGCSLSLLGTTMLAVSRPWMQSGMVARRDSLSFDTARLVDQLHLLLSRSETAVHLWSHLAPWCIAVLLFGVLLRLPVFPFHLWYRSSVINAPAGVTAIVAVALPMAALNAWLRIGTPLTVADTSWLATFLGPVAAIGAIHAGVMSHQHQDIREFAATASSGVLCLAVMIICLPTRNGLFGAWLLVLTQGVAVAAICLAADVIQLRCNRPIGIQRDGQPRLAGLLVALLLCWAGVPFLAGFAGSIQSGSTWLSLNALLALSAIGTMLLISTASLRTIGRILSMDKMDLTAFNRPTTPVVPAGASPTATGVRPSGPSPLQKCRDLSCGELLVFAPFMMFLVVANLASTLVAASCEPELGRHIKGSDRSAVTDSAENSRLMIAEEQPSR